MGTVFSLRASGRRGSTASLSLVMTLLLAVVLAPSVPQAAEAGGIESEIHDALREHIVTGYVERDAEKILSLYGGEAQIATFIRGILDKDAFASLLREMLALNSAMAATLEVGAVTFEGAEALVPLRLILERTDLAGKRKTTADRLYCRLRKQGTWKILVQTYLADYTLPPLTTAPGRHH
jgi:hypothetical protein